MKIRPLKISEIDGFYKLYQHSTQEENERFWPSLKIKSKAQIRKILESKSWFEIFVVEDKKKLIAYTIVGDFFRSWEKQIFMDDLFVLPDYRSKWTWSSILSFLKKKKKTIYLFVDIHNLKAVKFYKKNKAQMVELSWDQNYTMKID